MYVINTDQHRHNQNRQRETLTGHDDARKISCPVRYSNPTPQSQSDAERIS